MKQLTITPANNINELTWPIENAGLSLQSPALYFLKDLAKHAHLVVESSVPAVEVRNLIHSMHVDAAFIVDHKEEFLGIVTKEQVSDQSIVHRVSEGYSRHEIPVSDLMIKKQFLYTLHYSEIKKATIEDVISVMKSHNESYCLAIENSKVKGLFSATDISKKLHTPIYIRDTGSFFKAFNKAS